MKYTPKDFLKVFRRTKKNLGMPFLPDPEFSTVQGSSGQIDMGNYQMRFDLSNLPKGADPDKYSSGLSGHEIVHYLVCPFNTITSVKQYTELKKKFKNVRSTDMLAVIANVFNDFTDDRWQIEHNFDDITYTRECDLKNLKFDQLSDLTKIFYRSWELVTGHGLKIGNLKDQKLEAACQDVKDLFVRVRYSPSDYPSDTVELAAILYPFFKNLQSPPQDLKDAMKGDPVQLPTDDQVKGKPLPMSDIGKECDTAQDLADVMEKLGQQMGAGDPNQQLEVQRQWYRSRMVPVSSMLASSKEEEEVLEGFEKWGISDEAGSLNLPVSIGASPRLVPGVTTKKNKYKPLGSYSTRGPHPDVLIAIDCSRSMGKHQVGSKREIFTRAAYSIIHYVYARGAMFNTIAFSGTNQYKISRWTRDPNHAENVLMYDFVKGSIIPVNQINNELRKKNYTVTVIGTDARLRNPEEVLNLRKKNNYTIAFILGRGGHSEKFKQINAEMHYVNKESDIREIVLGRLGGRA